MNKRQKKKNLFIRNKKYPFFGMKRGRYIVVKVERLSGKIERISLHQDVLNEAKIQGLMNYQKIYLCKKLVGSQEYWWLASHKNRYKIIQVDKTFIEQTECEFTVVHSYLTSTGGIRNS